MNRIKELIEILGITQKDFAQKIGATEATVSRWTNRGTAPRINQVSRILDSFNVSADWLLGRDVPVFRSAEEATKTKRGKKRVADILKRLRVEINDALIQIGEKQEGETHGKTA